MSIKLGMVMDPIQSIKTYKDSSFAMLLAAQRKGWALYYMEQGDLYLEGSQARARMRSVTVQDNPDDWFTLGEIEDRPLAELDTVLMRKDPPFDMEYVYSTYVLEQAQAEGVLMVNDPQALRDANEKLYTAWFPQCCPPYRVTRSAELIKAFIEEHGDVVIKPLDGMGGASIFHIRKGDLNTGVIIETLTDHGRRMAMIQRYIPEIKAGDKRILLVDGEPAPYALARIPSDGDHRGNIAAGGRGEGQPLSDRDSWICEQVAPELKKRGLIFVGLDVIGDYLTEINVTSPTCIRELDSQFDLDIAGDLMNAIEARLAQ